MFNTALVDNPLGLSLTSSYFQHDGIDVLFSAQDLSGREHLGALIEDSDTSLTYLISRLPAGTVADVEEGRLDLRSAHLRGKHALLTRSWEQSPSWAVCELIGPPGDELLPDPGLLLRSAL